MPKKRLEKTVKIKKESSKRKERDEIEESEEKKGKTFKKVKVESEDEPDDGPDFEGKNESEDVSDEESEEEHDSRPDIEEEKKEEEQEKELRRSNRRKNIGLSDFGIDAAINTLIPKWKAMKKAGSKSETITLASKGKHACAARITMTDDTPIEGKFHNDGFHAEMDALQKVVAELDKRYETSEKPERTEEELKLGNYIKRIDIEREPCTRCAVVLKAINLGDKVFYKNSGQKDYPSWNRPELGVYADLALKIGIRNHTNKIEGLKKRKEVEDKIFSYFKSRKWW